MTVNRFPNHKPERVDWDLAKYTADIAGPVALDTSLGWTIRGRELLTVANPSLGHQSTNYPRPNALGLAKPKRHFRELIWLPYGSGNYWHFLNDFLGGLAMLPEGIPILVSDALRREPFFRFAKMVSTRLQDATIIPHSPGEWITTDRLLTAHPHFGAAHTFRDAIALLDQLPPIQSKPTGKIIIGRKGTRQLLNMAELSAALPDYSVVYFEGMSLVRQREIVNSADTIIALHGAGMANLAFHQHPERVRVLELRQASYDNPCFSYLCTEMGMQYADALIEGPFRADVAAVAAYSKATAALIAAL